MKHILIFGESIVHGVGGEHGGWADKLKASLHKDLYGDNGGGEAWQVYELGIPGETMPDVLARFAAELTPRVKGGDPAGIYIVFSAGTNDAKATDSPGNNQYTPEDFAASVHAFIHLAKDYSDHILGIGLLPVDPIKTNPKRNPLTGGVSYFSNERLKQFEQVFQRTCEAEGASFVPLFGQAPADWIQKYCFTDGVHPNDAGHEWVLSRVEPKLREMLGPVAA